MERELINESMINFCSCEKPEKFRLRYGIRTHDLSDTGAVPHQLSYQAKLRAGHNVTEIRYISDEVMR